MDYLLQFEAAMLKVMDAPERFRIEQKPDIRRALLMRFPYKIIYRLLEGQVQVLATAHKRRQPGYWLGRI